MLDRQANQHGICLLYSISFKQKMLERLTGKHAVSALELSNESGVRQQ
jgi:hypothetical protein